MTTGSDPGADARGRPPDQSDATFADVFNSLSFDSGRKRKRKKTDEPAQAQPAKQVPQEPPPDANAHVLRAGRPPGASWPQQDDDRAAARPDTGLFAEGRSTLDELADNAAIVRPYAWTRGRTRASFHFELETLVSTGDTVGDVATLPQLEHRTVAELCRHPHAVAEVAAKLSVPLGVARVLLSDMAEQGLITVHQTAAEDDDAAAHLTLMERVLSGLRRL